MIQKRGEETWNKEAGDRKLADVVLRGPSLYRTGDGGQGGYRVVEFIAKWSLQGVLENNVFVKL